MVTNGLSKRLERLERLEDYTAQVGAVRDDGRSRLMRQLVDLAERLHGTPEQPGQSPAEATVRAGLAAAEGHEGAEYARRFWSAVAERLHDYQRRGAP
jgi:hypothetical protein